jgi:hypothetical protein
MQRNAVNPQKRFGRQVTLRIEPELFAKLSERAETMTASNPGMAVSVSDVIRSTLAASFAVPAAAPATPLERMEKYAAIGRGEVSPAGVKKVRKSLPKQPQKQPE